jgi:hypothetical protein
MKWIHAAMFLMTLWPAVAGADQLNRFRDPNTRTEYQWYAHHESGDFSNYFWRHPDSTCGWLMVVSDPTSSGRGYVAESQILCAREKGTAHRLYPTLNLEKCLYGSYYSAFDVWLAAPPVAEPAWISLATYTNVKNWQDLFGVNLSHKDGQIELVLFHVPKFGQGRFERKARIGFPLKRWVKIEVMVDEKEGIRVFQDKKLVLQAHKDWGPAGPTICEAHWGLYAHGDVDFAHLLNDDILLRSNGRAK